MTPTARRRWTLATVSLATFMTYLDNNIVNVALPAIQRDLGLTTSGIEWVVTGYILTFAGLLLAGGRLGDIFGHRRLFLVGLADFTLASLAAGLAVNDASLIAARAVQGVGAALLTPTTLAIIAATFRTAKERAAAIGIWSAAGALALALGPLLGGLLTQHLSWGWIFFLNVPVGVVTAGLAIWAIDADRARARRALDVPGLISSALALFTLTFGLIEGSDRGWTSTPILGAFAVSLLATAVFVVVEQRATDPMIDVRLFRDRVFAGGVVAILMWGFGLFGIYFFTSLYLQGVLGFSPTESGATFVPMALVMSVTAAFADRVAERFGAHRSVALAMALMAAGIASMSLFGAGTSYLALMPSLVVIGIGGGLSVPLTAMVIGAMPAERSGVASGIFNAAREVAGLLGITVIGVVLTSRRAAELRSGAAPMDAFLSGYRAGLIVAGALVAAGGIAAWLALRDARPTDTADSPANTAEELVLAG